ncbi:protoporphyrinogen oxidase [Streptomyces sp. NPDC005805]|uniref:protoporphyrinogen oxidase n=1 Tax=Streptomyces sp. NPDC005805 TaxID=3157068 RepID=UPI0033CF6A82
MNAGPENAGPRTPDHPQAPGHPVAAPHVVVVGGGIAGLAAAHRLVGAGVRVTLLEATARLGGKLLAGEVAGVPVDLGAESMLARRPEGIELARAAGLGDRLQPPAVAVSAVWTRGALRPLPKGHVMGVPGTADALAGLLSDEGLARIAREAELPPAAVEDDVAIGAYVAERLGREVVDRLVEPLLGGVYAGDAYRISMRAAVPGLHEALRRSDSLLAAVREVQARGAAQQGAGPVFTGLAGGMGTLPDAVAGAVRAQGGVVRTDTPVLALRRTVLPDTGATGWTIRTDRETLTADAVVLAAPAWSAAALLAAEAPAAAAELGRVEYASMALATFAFRRADLGELPGSGFLVPPVDGRSIKASTFSSNKWRWVDESSADLFLLRTSLGRHGEEKALDREDAELVDLSLADLREAVGLTARPVAAEVTRWTGGLPQYPVGHPDRVARVREQVAALGTLRVCGAAYDGVGIPACAGSGRRAADEILATPTLARGTRTGTGE